VKTSKKKKEEEEEKERIKRRPKRINHGSPYLCWYPFLSQ